MGLRRPGGSPDSVSLRDLARLRRVCPGRGQERHRAPRLPAPTRSRGVTRTSVDRLPGMHDYAAIVRVHRSGQLSVRETAQRMGISRNTVRRALRAAPASGTHPPELEHPSGWLADTIELPDGGTLRIEIGNGLTPLELLTRLRDFADEQRRRCELKIDPGKES